MHRYGVTPAIDKDLLPLETTRTTYKPSMLMTLKNAGTYGSREERTVSLIVILVILLLVFGFGGYRMGPGIGYYGGGGISTILLIVIILLLLHVI